MAFATSSKKPNGHAAHLAQLCTVLALALGCCLPFLAPFDPARNTDFQGYMLLIIGALSWLAAGLRRPAIPKPSPLVIVLGVYLLCCLASLLVNPHFGYDFFGAPLVRLGAAGLIACAGFGLAAQSVPPRRFAVWLYGIICALAMAAIPYSWFHLHTLLRIGGSFSQADIFAVFIGCGLLFGVYLIDAYPRQRYYLIAGQALLVALLLLSGTRSVLLLTAVIYPLWQQRVHGWWPFHKWLAYVLCALVLFVAARALLPARITSAGYAAESVSYRLDLQKEAARAAVDRPLLGYGPGNLADALDCRKLQDHDLRQTCRKGYFFNSSHDIFLDRVLAVGWLGGLCYLLFVAGVLLKSWRRGRKVPIEAAAALLIAGYYLTNVTSVPLELLFWALLLRAAWPSRASASR